MSKTGGPLFLAVAVAATSTLVLGVYDYDGHDFTYSVWAPTRALLDGLNPYDPGEVEYFYRYQVPIVAPLYTPATLFVFATLSWLPASVVATVIAGASVAMMWIGVLLLIPPRSATHRAAAAGAGTLLLLSSAADHTIELGQLSAFAFGGLALVAASLRRDPTAAWLPAVGTFFISLKPQSGIPMLIALGLLHRWDVLRRSVLLIGAASVPPLALLLLANGPAEALGALRQNPNVFWMLPTTNLAVPTNLRIDVLGVMTHLNGPDLNGFGWSAVAFVMCTALFFLALRICGRSDTRVETSATGITVLALYITASLYHLSYDQLLLYAGPLMALGAVADRQNPPRSSRWLAAAAIVLAVAGILSRPGVRVQLVEWGASALAVHRAWVAGPTVVTTLLVVGIVGSRWRDDSQCRERRQGAAEAV